MYIELVRLIIILLLTTAVVSMHDRLLQLTAGPGMYYVAVGSSPSQPRFPGVCILLTYRGVHDHARAQFDLLW